VIKQYLSESVRKDVNNYDSANEIWKRLDQKYGNKQKLIDSIMHDIKGLSNCDNDDDATLEMIQLIESAHLDLEKINEESEMQNSTIISIIEQQMPKRMLNEWVEIAVALNDPRQKFNKLLSFLQQWKIRIEYFSSDFRSSPSSTHNKIKHKCWLHKDCEHPIWKCRLFQSLSVKERIELTKSNNACLSCLELGHTSENCQRSFICPENGCTAAHNHLLHE